MNTALPTGRVLPMNTALPMSTVLPTGKALLRSTTLPTDNMLPMNKVLPTARRALAARPDLRIHSTLINQAGSQAKHILRKRNVKKTGSLIFDHSCPKAGESCGRYRCGRPFPGKFLSGRARSRIPRSRRKRAAGRQMLDSHLTGRRLFFILNSVYPGMPSMCPRLDNYCTKSVSEDYASGVS